ncbi:MAG: glycosyltransferase family 87 protein [Polyangiaceae bacterium]
MGFLAVCFGIVAPPTVVALSLVGLPPLLALLLVLGLAAGCAWRWSPRWTSWAAPLRDANVWFALWIVVGLAASVQEARLAHFMLDANRADQSVLPWRPFYREHCCLTAYTEAARLLPSGANVYDPTPYKDPLSTSPGQARRMGQFEVDVFEYPPPFLILPRLALAAGLDFLTIRSGWFVVQALVLLGALVAIAAWIGGRTGVRAGLLLPLVFAAPPVLLTLQIGNFQVTAIPLAMLAMLAFAQERPLTGGLALGFATLSKIFPGGLGLLLLAERRWRATLWTLAASAAFLALALVMLGSGPFLDFFRYQLPRISSGEAFSWIEIPIVAIGNASVYGLVTKLRLLGLPWTDKAFAVGISHAYMIALLPLTLLAARRLQQLERSPLPPEALRLRQAQTWLGLLSLASFRSPFVPDAYAAIGSLWLLTLLAAERRTRAQQTGLGVAGLAFCLLIDDALLPPTPPLWSVMVTLATQVLLIAFNVWVVLRPSPRAVPAEISTELPPDGSTPSITAVPARPEDDSQPLAPIVRAVVAKMARDS